MTIKQTLAYVRRWNANDQELKRTRGYGYRAEPSFKGKRRDIPVPGRLRIVEPEVWYAVGSWQSDILESPTWTEILKQATLYIRACKTGDHVYLEDFFVVRTERGIQICQMFLGS